MLRRFFVLALLPLAACNLTEEGGSVVADPAAPAAVTMTAIEDPVLPHLIQVSERIWSGAAPEGEAAFAALAARGVTTLVNVDGARPQVELAAKYGLRYVHVPFGYDGVPRAAALQITRVMEESTGTVFFHCHHGVHRGPVAAAIALQVDSGCSPAEAEPLLRLAHTDPKYRGLWRANAEFRRFDADVPRPPLHEIAPVGDFTSAMARMDRDWDRVKLVREANWSVPTAHPDLLPAKEAKILSETFTALDGTLDAEQKSDAEFLRHLRNGQRAADALRAALEARDAAGAETSFTALKQSCADCHASYRN